MCALRTITRTGGALRVERGMRIEGGRLAERLATTGGKGTPATGPGQERISERNRDQGVLSTQPGALREF
jgi:hypothetical protein